MSQKKTSHTFRLSLYGRDVPLLITAVALPHDKDNVKLSVTHTMTTTSFVVPVGAVREMITVLHNAVQDVMSGNVPAVPAVLEQAVRVSGPPIDPVAPAMPGQSGDGGEGGGAAA